MAGAVKSRGQVSIEFLLIIIISLIYIYTVARPVLVDTGAAAAEDVKRVSDAKIAAQKLANSINEAAAGSGESKRTVHLFLPAKASVACGENVIEYTAKIANLYCRNPLEKKTEEQPISEGACTYSAGNCSGPPYEGEYECGGSIELLDSADPNCDAVGSIEGPLYRAVVVEKGAAGITVEWAE